MNPVTLFPETPVFSFYPEMKYCPRCGIKMNVLKTRRRAVVTMGAGAFIARETHLHCPRHQGIIYSEEFTSPGSIQRNIRLRRVSACR